MREHTGSILLSWISENVSELKSIAVVGGSSQEPELLGILNLFPNVEVSYFGIEISETVPNFIFLDLNTISEVKFEFDLVICNQVLEHLWNINSAFVNLTNLTKANGLLWINCPASNMYHGSPEYYSAGYSADLLKEQLNLCGHVPIRLGQLGSRRAYFFTHALQYWPSTKELAHPILSFRPLKSYGKRFVQESFLGFLGRVYASLLSNEVTKSEKYATEVFSLSTFKESSRL